VVYLGILALSNFYFFTMNGGIDFLKVLTGVFLDFLVSIGICLLLYSLFTVGMSSKVMFKSFFFVWGLANLVDVPRAAIAIILNLIDRDVVFRTDLALFFDDPQITYGLQYIDAFFTIKLCIVSFGIGKAFGGSPLRHFLRLYLGQLAALILFLYLQAISDFRVFIR
jgi:hypothetical protein